MLFITFFGLSTFPHINPQTKELFTAQASVDYWIRWANWDGGHFRGIAENNYLPQQTVFFPLYAMLIKFLMFFNIPSLWGGLIISNLATVLTLFFLYKLTLLDFTEKVAKGATFTLLIFPTSFYLGAVYSESLFLAVTLSSFYFARKKAWGWASLFAGASIATRLVGLVTILAILVEYLLTKKILTRKLVYIFSSLLPFWLYIIYLKFKFQNSLIFLTSEENWNRRLIFPWVALQKIPSFTDLLFFLMGLVALVAIYKSLPKSYFIFSLMAFLIPLFSGTLLAFPRYLLVIFPIYVIFANIKNELLQKIGVIFSILLLSAYSMLFINGYWVT